MEILLYAHPCNGCAAAGQVRSTVDSNKFSVCGNCGGTKISRLSPSYWVKLAEGVNDRMPLGHDIKYLLHESDFSPPFIQHLGIQGHSFELAVRGVKSLASPNFYSMVIKLLKASTDPEEIALYEQKCRHDARTYQEQAERIILFFQLRFRNTIGFRLSNEEVLARIEMRKKLEEEANRQEVAQATDVNNFI